jgi:type IV secretion system protein VirD4
VVTKNRPRFWAWAKWDRQSEAEHPHRRPLMLPQEIARLSPSEQIILRAGMPPMKTQRVAWFSDFTLTSRVRPAPEIPRLNVLVELDDGSTKIGQPHQRLKTFTAADVEEPAEEDM